VATARKRPARAGPQGLTATDVTKWGLRDACDAGGRPPHDPVDETTVARVVAWIAVRCEPLPHIRRRLGARGGPLSSYGWKHAAESPRGGIGRYVSNGEFILAALRAGYRAVPVRPGSPNALFNMRLRPATRAAQDSLAAAPDTPCAAAPRVHGRASPRPAGRSVPTRDGRARVYVVAVGAAAEASRPLPATSRAGGGRSPRRGAAP
jgi:hypothetical protein